MTKLRKCIVAAMATAILAGSALTSQDRAWAGSFNSEMPAMGRAHGHEGGGFRHHGGGGGWGRFGTGLAIGLGVELLSQAIADQAAEQRQAAQHAQIHRDVERQGWTPNNEKRHRCYELAKFDKLLDDAKAIRARMVAMHEPQDIIDLQDRDIRDRSNDVRDAKLHCKKH